nr:hypothetical protein GCM10017745_09170 [Saccharothrix mutabilis subsp. capreolus]
MVAATVVGFVVGAGRTEIEALGGTEWLVGDGVMLGTGTGVGEAWGLPHAPSRRPTPTATGAQTTFRAITGSRVGGTRPIPK